MIAVTPPRATLLDLRALDLPSGAGASVRVPVEIEDLVLGGQVYRVDPAEPEGRVEVSSSGSGLLFRLRLAAELTGPCWRCLDPAGMAVRIDAREFAAAGRPPDAPFDEDLDSAYLDAERLDLSTWARDALVEALPDQIVCRPDCAGICAGCGADLNAGTCDCPPPAPDERWAALGPLAERLRRQAGSG